MNATFSLYPLDDIPGAFGYAVEGINGLDVISVRQDFKPGASGQVPMSETEARDLAEALVAELQGS
jgi:hypothetical protein